MERQYDTLLIAATNMAIAIMNNHGVTGSANYGLLLSREIRKCFNWLIRAGWEKEAQKALAEKKAAP